MSVERVDIYLSGSPWKEEHLARYNFAKEKIKDKIVLDLACGTGFGSEFIAKNNPKELQAVDVSEEAVAQTKLKVKGFENCFASKQDGTILNFENDYFDLIFCIETIEHVEKDQVFLKELNRVLKPSGSLIISTPNGAITNPSGGKPENPFHIREYTIDQFKELMSSYFIPVFEAGQSVIKSYGVAPFLPSFSRRRKSLREKINKIYWSTLLRLPFRNQVHNLFFGHNFYPSVKDYTFLKGDLTHAHVQYYFLKPKK